MSSELSKTMRNDELVKPIARAQRLTARAAAIADRAGETVLAGELRELEGRLHYAAASRCATLARQHVAQMAFDVSPDAA